MKQNKKAFGKWAGIMKLVLFFNIISWLFLFIFNLTYDIGDDYIIYESYNATLELMNSGQLNVSDQTITFLETTRDTYYETNLPIDLFFLAFFLNIFILSAVAAFKSRKSGLFSFFGYVTWGLMLFLFLLTFIEQITTWLFDNAYYNLFNLDRQATPLADWFIENSSTITFFWFVFLMIISQFDFKWMLGKLRVEGGFER